MRHTIWYQCCPKILLPSEGVVEHIESFRVDMAGSNPVTHFVFSNLDYFKIAKKGVSSQSQQNLTSALYERENSYSPEVALGSDGI